MFNAPRSGQGRLTSGAPFGGSFVDDVSNPLSASFEGYDPWSGANTPPPPERNSAFSGVIGNADLPVIYEHAFSTIDPNASGETSVNTLVKVLETSSLSASVVDRIVNLVSTKTRVSRMEFFVALALVALAQQGKDPSIEEVAALAQANALPQPTLNLSAITFASVKTNATATDTAPRAPRAMPPAYSSEDPWGTSQRTPNANAPSSTTQTSTTAPVGASTIEGTGLPPEWWKRQERIVITNMGQQGFLLNRYTIYQVQSERGSVTRRYSEFAFLWDVLLRRYPFRIMIPLPPKRIGGDEGFTEQRRRGLARFMNHVVNHPIIKDDGLLSVFLAEPSFDTWKKQHSVSLDEESISKRLDRTEEMSIPGDLEERLKVLRQKIPAVIDQWNRICFLADRLIRRREGAAADFSRIAVTLKALNEVNAPCWRGDACELCGGVREGLERVSGHLQSASDVAEQRALTLMYNALEALKSQRDLMIATRDWFIRHDRQSIDQVEKLRKRVEQNSVKLEQARSAQRDNWQTEADKFAGLIERDQVAISAALARRVFIRFCMWHEMRVVLHNRENALLSQAIQAFAQEESAFTELTLRIWEEMTESVAGMPLE